MIAAILVIVAAAVMLAYLAMALASLTHKPGDLDR